MVRLAHLELLEARAHRASPATPDSQVWRVFRDPEACREIPVHKEPMVFRVCAVPVDHQAERVALVY